MPNPLGLSFSREKEFALVIQSDARCCDIGLFRASHQKRAIIYGNHYDGIDSIKKLLCLAGKISVEGLKARSMNLGPNPLNGR